LRVAADAAGGGAGESAVMQQAAVDLYWIPLGAGGCCVAFNGRVYEAVAAAYGRRRRCRLYHSALVVSVDGARYTIELAPSPDADLAGRGVLAAGPVGARWAGRLRVFRYELRCWRGGTIPDLAYAVDSPRRLSDDARVARRLVQPEAAVPTPVWGRDELGLGEMWNCNSVIAWLLASAGLPAGELHPPPHGRAPGWAAGLAAARGSRRVRVSTDPDCGGFAPPSSGSRGCRGVAAQAACASTSQTRSKEES
jgi:hypothetical protein